MPLNTTIALTLLLSSNASKMANETTVASPQMVDNRFVFKIVQNLQQLYEFKNFVFFISPRLAIESEIADDFLQGFWKMFPFIPTVMMLNNKESMRGFLGSSSLCMVLTTHLEDPIMEVAALAMKGVRLLKTMFILFPQKLERAKAAKATDPFQEHKFFEDLGVLYNWIWKKQFINTLLITIHNNVFIQEPYPMRKLVNITNNWNAHSFFVNYRDNFKGYVIRTPLRHDLPRIFYMTRLPNSSKRTHRVSGVSGKLFMAFLGHINATFDEYYKDGKETEPVQLAKIIEMVESGELDISLHSYTDMLKSTAGNSYPIGINDWCFMHNLSLAFLQAISSMLLIMPLRILTLPIARIRFIYVLLFLLGFLVTNLYVSKMASFLTASPTVPQISTVQDIIDAKLGAMIMAYEYEILKEFNWPKQFMDLVVNATKPVMDKHRDRLNTSYGYATQTDRWVFANRQQRYMKKPIFRLSDTCIGPYYHVYPMLRDSHLAQPLEAFIVRSLEAGLILHWEREAFQDALYLGYMRMIPENCSIMALKLDFFRSIWYLWWFGLILGSLVFYLEVKRVTWWKIKEYSRKLCNKILEL
uniref:Ionotropic glutamate receptor C-terminal domain-containing protein n=1 Tax=Stomoxys calcitrans TaxID=35570 RepID=A0A1I8PUH3_STOCA